MAGLAAAAGYYIYLHAQPACGAPGNTALGHSNRYVPWALLATQILVVAALGRILRRQPKIVVAGVALASVVAMGAGILVFLFWFGAGDCGE